jgi:hypothetical protein
MEEMSTSTMKQTHPDLLVPPHILAALLRLTIEGEWQAGSEEQEQITAHLATCQYCRSALIGLLSMIQEQERREASGETSAHDILTHFVAIDHEIAAIDDEQIGAYAEAIVYKGRKNANRLFPRLAKHVRKCTSCNSRLKATLAFLRKSNTVK